MQLALANLKAASLKLPSLANMKTASLANLDFWGLIQPRPANSAMNTDFPNPNFGPMMSSTTSSFVEKIKMRVRAQLRWRKTAMEDDVDAVEDDTQLL